MSDQDLINRFLAGDSQAFGELWEKYEEKIGHLALRFLKNHDDVADAKQDVAVLLLKRLHQFRGDSKFSSWLFRLCVNSFLMNIRKRKRHSYVDVEECADSLPTNEPSLDRVLHYEQLFALVASAAMRRDGKVFELKGVQELGSEDAAAEMAVSLPCIKSRWNRLKRRMEARLCGKMHIPDIAAVVNY